MADQSQQRALQAEVARPNERDELPPDRVREVVDPPVRAAERAHATDVTSVAVEVSLAAPDFRRSSSIASASGDRSHGATVSNTPSEGADAGAAGDAREGLGRVASGRRASARVRGRTARGRASAAGLNPGACRRTRPTECQNGGVVVREKPGAARDIFVRPYRFTQNPKSGPKRKVNSTVWGSIASMASSKGSFFFKLNLKGVASKHTN